MDTDNDMYTPIIILKIEMLNVTRCISVMSVSDTSTCKTPEICSIWSISASSALYHKHFNPKIESIELKDTIYLTNEVRSNYMSTIRFMAAVVVPYSSCRYTLQPLRLELRYKLEIKSVINNNYINLPTSIRFLSEKIFKFVTKYCISMKIHTCSPFGN
jgi:hypothetical protein